MSYHFRDHIPFDYAAMHAGQHVDDDQDEFHNSFHYQPPPAPVLPSTSQVQPSSTPFTGTQTNTIAPNEDVAALTAEIARVRAENEALERETEVARLKAELVTLQQRNAQLQKQKQPSSNPTIKTLRANLALTARVSEELERLGFSSSGSDEEENPHTRCSRGKPRLKSGKTTKLTSRVVFPQLWPHSQLSLANVFEVKGYDELTIAEFSAGYTSILKLPSISDSERNARLDHFIGLMYLVMQFTWPAVHEFHATVLFEIECGRAWWGDSFPDLETHLLRNSSRSTGTALARRSGAPVLFCQDFQHGKCGHSKDHYGTIRNETKWLQHICAKCWTVSCVIAKHPEYSADCPTKNVVSGLASDQPSSVTLPS